MYEIQSTSAKYTYHLAKDSEVKAAYGHRLTCPSCGRPKCFVPYVDASGEPITTQVGKCDHQNSCGYHYTPGEYFKEHKDGVRRSERPRYVQPIKPLRSYIIEDVYSKTMGFYHRNTFTVWLRTILGDDTDRAIMDWRIGTARNGSTVFWQFDNQGMCRGGKVMLYDPNNGHRVKSGGNGVVTWVHRLLKLESYNLEQCLFGLHRVQSHDGVPVAVFESEKTAILADTMLNRGEYNFPCVCVATGGAGNLKDETMRALRGRDVIIFPDEGMFTDWYDRAARLAVRFSSLKISTICEPGHYCHTGDGCDLGDFIVENAPNWEKTLIDIHLGCSLVDIA